MHVVRVPDLPDPASPSAGRADAMVLVHRVHPHVDLRRRPPHLPPHQPDHALQAQARQRTQLEDHVPEDMVRINWENQISQNRKYFSSSFLFFSNKQIPKK